MKLRLVSAAIFAGACVLVPPTPSAAAKTARYVARTPDAMLDLAVERAKIGDEAALLEAAAIALRLDSSASHGAAARAIAALVPLAKDAELAAELALVAAELDPESAENVRVATARGVVPLAVVGPFRDTGGGLDKAEGPELDNASNSGSPPADYSWGAYEVRWRTAVAYPLASGVPLERVIFPRKESCTYVATKLVLTDARAFVVSVAASGQVRLVVDGETVAKSDEVHSLATFERLRARVDAKAGVHVVGAKVCSGATPDEGRVRLRLSDGNGSAASQSATAHGAGMKGSPAKAKVERVPTALERVVAAKGKRSLEARLSEAVVRTFGGADDQRSPRVGGLLDGLARDPKVAPDALALLAWASPSMANRSGWLHVARARAAASSDAETLGFIARRETADRIAGHQADWAMMVWQEEKKNGVADDEAVTLEVAMRDALGTDALRTEALGIVRTRLSKDRTSVSTDVLRLALRLGEMFDRTVSASAAEELVRRRAPSPAALRALTSRGREALVDSDVERTERLSSTADELRDVALLFRQAGDTKASRARLEKYLKDAPNRGELWALFGQVTADYAAELARSGGSEPAKDLVPRILQRARDLLPGDARVRAELAYRATPTRLAGGAADRAPADDERYLASSETILARRQGVGNRGAADRQLHWLRAVILQPDRRVSQVIHYAREIVVPPRSQDELFEDLPAEGDVVEILRARVHRKSGGVAFPAEEHNEGTRPRIRWPELQQGDTVEVAIRTWTRGPVGGRGDAPFYFLDYAGSPSTHPLLYNEVIVEARGKERLAVDVVGPKQHEHTVSDDGGRHVERFVWRKPMIVADEPLAPALSEIVPMIVGSTFASWADFRKWYAEAVRGFTEPDDEVRRLAAELTKGKVTRDEKLRAIFEFVADDIRYVNYTSGEFWLPNRPQQLLARREGDCDDKAILLITLLRSVGIEAEEVLVQTRQTGMPSVLSAEHAAVPMFDHGIAYLKDNGGMYLDATSPQSRLGPLPSMDARAVALRMEGPPSIVKLPPSSPDDHGSDVAWTIDLAADGSADLRAEERHMGDSAFYLRTYLSEADARTQYVEENLVGSWLPTVQVDKAIDFKGNLAKGQARVTYKAKSQGYARKEGDELVVPLASSQSLASQLAPLVVRELPVVLPPYLAPSHQDRTTRIVAPPGFVWGPIPDGGEIDGRSFGKAKLELSVVGRTLTVKRHVVFDDHVVPRERYSSWRHFVQDIDSLTHKSVRLLPAAGAAARANAVTPPLKPAAREAGGKR